jgi:hypothetical protein
MITAGTNNNANNTATPGNGAKPADAAGAARTDSDAWTRGVRLERSTLDLSFDYVLSLQRQRMKMKANRSQRRPIGRCMDALQRLEMEHRIPTPWIVFAVGWMIP